MESFAMKYGLDISIAGEYSDPRTLADLAFEAEQAGWDGFFLWNVIFYADYPDVPIVEPSIALAAIAMKTQCMKIGILLTPLARRRPWIVARESSSLDHLSNGRLIFGAGLGYYSKDFTAFGEEYAPMIRAEKLEEGLEVLTGLWTGESFSFHGRHYQVNNVRLLPKPLQSPRIPIWIGGYWPNLRPFRRAARWDGLYSGTEKANGESLTLEDFKEVVAYVRAQRETSNPFDIAVAGVTPPNHVVGTEIIHPYIEAGATWWLEVINDNTGSFDEMKKRIRNGPPKRQTT
jgi:alkanesulfonate monooxygenase SsuD/methylene tetrahydromethanopterin reductase-like flavin-dependent oxidoreductase (luciferase family)